MLERRVTATRTLSRVVDRVEAYIFIFQHRDPTLAQMDGTADIGFVVVELGWQWTLVGNGP